ncbi:glycosyltransferase [Salinibacterium sp. GXW1014]|uniref:glycosyltransferase n=1 Tax=Salinibacterium sp. GXW1014 TaxID=3377838 RepID=UPI00383A7094
MQEHQAAPDSTLSQQSPLRVLIGCDTFPPDVNGAANFAARLAAGLTQRGHEVVVEAPAFSRRHGRFTEEHDGAKFTVHRVYSWRWYPHDWLRFVLPWRSQAHAARILDEVKPDVVHIQSHIVVGRGLARQASKRGIRVIGTNHFMPENMIEHALLPKFLQKPVIRAVWADASRTFALCAAVTTPTKKAAAFLEHETTVKGVHAISCGIDASLYTPSFEQPKEHRIVFVGRVTGEKHIDVLLRAVAKLDPALDTKVDIVGGGDQLAALKQLAVSLGIRSNVNFTGYVSDEDLRAVLTRASVFAMPSIAELQSIATMEAMASGLPVVAADAMALPHLVHDGENGFLFEPGDADDLADKLTRVLRMPWDEALQLKRASLKLIEAHDIERTLNTFESLYRGEAVADPAADVTLGEPAP